MLAFLIHPIPITVFQVNGLLNYRLMLWVIFQLILLINFFTVYTILGIFPLIETFEIILLLKIRPCFTFTIPTDG